MKKIALLLCLIAFGASAQKEELIKYGDFENWVTRNIKESRLLGGHDKTLYEIAPTTTLNGNTPYSNMGGSPWATSNVLASPVGIVKTSNAVFPDTRAAGNKCAKLTTRYEECKVLGMVNMEVMVAGSIFLGRMFEPIKSTSNPYSKMEMGVPFTRRPKALKFDYKLSIPNTNQRIYSSGFGKKKVYDGTEVAEAFILLQRRWEDAEGNLYAKRVGTGRVHLDKSTNGWVNGFTLPVLYGNISGRPDFKPYMGLISEADSYYARNSKGKMVPVKEVDWDAPDAAPTHLLVMFSAASGKAYIGTLDLTLWLDNVKLVY